MNIEILLADLSNAHHAETLISLLDQYARDPMGGAEPLPEYSKQNLAVELHKRDTASVILAFVDGQAAGLINVIEGFSTFACKPLLNIHDVYVKDEYRGLGLSRSMFDKVEEIAQALGCCKLTLEVLENNQLAKTAYSNFGFKGYQLLPEYGNAVFMEKKL